MKMSGDLGVVTTTQVPAETASATHYTTYYIGFGRCASRVKTEF
jgi:hypothetical protein